MAAETSFKLKADIGPFKTAMTEAKAATKTLDAELKLAQAQFKATGDAEQYLDTRSKVLNQQMVQQQKAVDSATRALEQMRNAGIDPTDTAYQQMQRSLYDAEREMVRLREEADKTGDELLETSSDATSLGTSLKSIEGAAMFSAIGQGFQSIKGIVRDVAQTVTQMINSMREAGQWADELITSSKRYGLTEEELQRYEYAAQFVDTDVDTILKARDKLMQKTSSDDFISIVDGMTQYGVSLKDAAGNARDTMDVFWDFIDVLGQMQDATTRDQLAQEYFGKSFRDLGTLYEKGRAGWEEYMAQAAVVTDDNVKKLGEMDDSLNRLDSHLNVLTTNLKASASTAVKVGADVLDAVMIDKGLVDAPITAEHVESVTQARDFLVSVQKWRDSITNSLGLLSDETYNERWGKAGEDAVDAFAAGAEENVEMAASAGAALAAAIVNAFASVAPASAGAVTNNTTNQNFGNTFVLDASLSPDLNAAVAEAHRRAQAGYGG